MSLKFQIFSAQCSHTIQPFFNLIRRGGTENHLKIINRQKPLKPQKIFKISQIFRKSIKLSKRAAYFFRKVLGRFFESSGSKGGGGGVKTYFVPPIAMVWGQPRLFLWSNCNKTWFCYIKNKLFRYLRFLQNEFYLLNTWHIWPQDSDVLWWPKFVPFHDL